MGSLQGHEVFDEAEPMYPEAAIKSFLPQKHTVTGSKSLTKLAMYSTRTFALNSKAMSGGVLSDPSLTGSTSIQISTLNLNQKTSDEK
jgi:hypothetical protein